MRQLSSIFLGFLFLFGMGTGQSHAAQSVTFGPHETDMEGSIKYTILGNYTARFDRFQGRITWDERSQRVRSVNLNIEAGSIRSDHPRFDRIARSRRLLNTVRYPRIIFKSDSIMRGESGYLVNGILEMHGIKRRMSFPFHVDLINDQKNGGKWLDLKGNWNINRKDFNIIWNRYLDHGGILVSDIFTVKWGIRVNLMESSRGNGV